MNSTVSNEVKIIHQNIQSIGSCIDELQFFVDQQNYHFICVTEHWKTNQQLKMFPLKGYYQAASFCRSQVNSHGRTVIYARKGIIRQERTDFKFFSLKKIFECTAGEFMMNNDEFLIVSLYSVPGNSDILIERLEEILAVLIKLNKCRIVIAGDFNVDFCSSSKEKLEVVSLINSYGIYHTIFQPIFHVQEECFQFIS